MYKTFLTEKAKEPQMMKDLKEWLSVKYPKITFIDYPKYRGFQEKEDRGMTAFKLNGEFNNAGDKFIAALDKVSKFSDLRKDWAMDVVEIPWNQNKYKGRGNF
jgi:hypothetical protein